jgi:AcrR family transcriptional regulator
MRSRKADHTTTPRQRKPADAPGSARSRIILGAHKHFLAHGFRSVTMDDLAEELAMSKKTLYAHFSSKHALVEAVLRDKADRIDADLSQITTGTSGNFLKTLHDLLACLQRHTGEIRPPFVRDLRREAPELFKIVEDRRRTIIHRHFGSFFARGRRLGRIRQDIPVEVIIEVLLAATQAIMNPPKMEELGLSPKAGYTAIISIVLEGVVKTARRSK